MSMVETPAELSITEFEKIARILDRESAIQVSEGQEYLVETRLKKVVRSFELESLSELVTKLESHKELLAATIDAMTTNETLFFRDRFPFDVIRDHLLPTLVAERRTGPITIWCAACSSGQEPYSLAMLLLERFPDLVVSRGIKIVATDLSASMIERCKEGRYTQFETNRGLPAPMLIEYFDQVGRDWVIRDDLRSMIDFRVHNLMDSWSDIPRCDIVLLRNVLIYFTVDVKTQILTRLREDVLLPGGALFLGSSETTINLDDSFEREKYERSVLYRSPSGEEAND